MMYTLGDRKPQISGNDYYVADGAIVVGNVELENNTSVWFNAVIRADNDVIHLGEGTNVQDGAILHTDPGYPMRIGRYVTIGHKAMLHGCEIGDNSLIGINAVILNGAKIGRNCLIGANSLITEGTVIPDGSLVVGSPGKVMRTLGLEEQAKLKESANGYIANFKRFKETLKSLD